MKQTTDLNGKPIPNVGVYIGAPITLASGTSSNAFLKDTWVEVSARTAECFFLIGTGTVTATTSHHPLPVGASRQMRIPIGHKIANTGGSLVVSILGAAGNTVAEYYV